MHKVVVATPNSKFTFDNIDDIKIEDGHLHLLRKEKVVVVFAPGWWSHFEVVA